MEAMREGRITVQQQVHHADGKVTSSIIYGNDVGDGIDRSLNIFGTMGDIFAPALQKATTEKNQIRIMGYTENEMTHIPFMYITFLQKKSVHIHYNTAMNKFKSKLNFLNVDFIPSQRLHWTSKC